ncbi:MAG: EAL domain-containing protein [Arcobacteraceae bacterium]|nr:EAL domain-containing protein [Arcobacteraceae bacterium]
MAFDNELLILQQYKELIDNNIIVTKTDPKGNITFANDKFCDISGYTKEELLGQPHNIVRFGDVDPAIFKDMWNTIKNKKETWTGQIKNKKKDGTAYYVDAIVRPIINEKGETVEYIALRYDVSNFINAKKLLFDDILHSKYPFLVVIQIEGYESLESFYGKEITQIIEDKFATHLLEYCPIGCVFPKVYQLDNGYFGLLRDLQDSGTLAESQTMQLKKFQQNIKDGVLSFGTYEYDLHVLLSYGIGKEHLYEDVMIGLKKAQESKKDFIFADNFTKIEKDKAHQNLHTINMIKKALHHDKIISYFQPIVNTRTGEIDKYESLVRLEKDDGKILSPYFFLDVSKNGKYYHQITNFVIANSFEALRKTDKEVSINLSTLDIEDVELRNNIITQITMNADISSRIVFELLEDEEVNDFEIIKDFIALVKMFGVKIAIDDFGAGHSNFERLLDFQPDILKLDGSLIKDIDKNQYSRDIVETIKSFADKQGIKTVAEFVHNKAVLDVIQEIGIDYLQGYYLGEPQIELAASILNPKDFRI